MSKLLIDEPPLQLLPGLAVALDSVTEAVVIQQVHWLTITHSSRVTRLDGLDWFAADLDFFARQFPFLSDSTIKRTFASLAKKGVLKVKRGQESNVYAIDQDALSKVHSGPQNRSKRPPETGQNDLHKEDREELQRETTERHGGAASDSTLSLPGMEPPAGPAPVPAVKPEDAVAEQIFRLWQAICQREDAEYSEARKKAARKCARESTDMEEWREIIEGFAIFRRKKAERESGKPKLEFTEISSTFGQSGDFRSRLEFFKDQAADRAALPSSVPSGHRARVLDLATQVLKAEHQPDNEAVRERARQAQAILRERFGLKVTSDGNGKLLRFEATQ